MLVDLLMCDGKAHTGRQAVGMDSVGDELAAGLHPVSCASVGQVFGERSMTCGGCRLT